MLDRADKLKDFDYDLSKLRGGGGKGGKGFGKGGGGLFGSAHSDGDEDVDEEASDEADSSEDSNSDGAPPGPSCFHCGTPAWQTLAATATWVTATDAATSQLLHRALNGNAFEVGVLTEWVASRGGLGAKLVDLLTAPNPAGAPPIRVRPEHSGLTPAATHFHSLPVDSWGTMHACRNCTFCLMAGATYSLRERIPEAELPDRARGRGNCWYGRSCRTQNHKFEHAERLNHICEQTRF